jgi:aspartyl-tRNA(Asn)/glutamyl-tRNA(Gln) amidotransferase subunit C
MNESNPDLDHVDIHYVAGLARIALTDEEAGRLEGELDQVLAYVRKLNELDLEGIDPMSHPRPLENVLREDEERREVDPEDLMRNAPATIQGLVRVPQMMEDT